MPVLAFPTILTESLPPIPTSTHQPQPRLHPPTIPTVVDAAAPAQRASQNGVPYYVTLTITRNSYAELTTILLGTITSNWRPVPSADAPQPTSLPSDDSNSGGGGSGGGGGGGLDSARKALIVLGAFLGTSLVLLLWWLRTAATRRGWGSTTTTSRPSSPHGGNTRDSSPRPTEDVPPRIFPRHRS